MERLRQDLINKSKLVEPSSQITNTSSATRALKTFKVFVRGGSQELLYKNAEQIKEFIMYLLVFVQERASNNKKIYNFIISGARLYLHFLLLVWRVDVKYFINPLTGQPIVITMVVGGTTGFIISWIGIGTTIVANCLGASLLSRGLVNQLSHNIEYRKFHSHVVNLLKDEEFQKRIVGIAERISDNKLKPQTLNWDKNPAIKEAAERLGIFEENPNLGLVKSSENSLYNRHLEKLQKAAKKVIDVETDLDIVDSDFIAKNQSINIPHIKIRD